MSAGKIIQLVIGIVLLVAVLTYGIVSIVKTPKNQKFTKAALTKLAVTMVFGIIGGICLIAFSFVK